MDIPNRLGIGSGFLNWPKQNAVEPLARSLTQPRPMWPSVPHEKMSEVAMRKAKRGEIPSRPFPMPSKPVPVAPVQVTGPVRLLSEEFPLSMYSQKEFDHRCASFADKGVRVSELLK